MFFFQIALETILLPIQIALHSVQLPLLISTITTCMAEIGTVYIMHIIFKVLSLLCCTFVWIWRCSVNNTLYHMISYQITAATIPYLNLLKTKFSKRCNSCPECPNNTKFCPQTDFSLNILILSSISAEYANKMWIKITRIGESRQLLPVGLYFIRINSYTDQLV